MSNELPRRNNTFTNQKGISLIEVMVAMVVITIGFTSVTLLQLRSLQASHSSYQQSLAAVQAGDLVESLWANACVIDVAGVLADVEEAWFDAHEGNDMMPNWDGSIVPLSTNAAYEITIEWDDRLDSENKRIYRYIARIPSMTCEAVSGANP